MTDSLNTAGPCPGSCRVRWSGALALVIGLVVLGLGRVRQGAVRPDLDVTRPAPAQSAPDPVVPEPSLGTPAAPLPEVDGPLSFSLRVVADRELPQHKRLKPLVDGSTVVITAPEDLLALRRILRDPTEGDTLRNESANALRINASPDLADDLRAVLADLRNGARFRSFAAQHLGVLFEADPSDKTLRQSLRAALEDAAVKVRREALWPLSRQGDPVALALAAAWVRDPDQAALHDLCCRIAALTGCQTWLEPVQVLARADDEVVRRAAHQALAALEAGP